MVLPWNGFFRTWIPGWKASDPDIVTVLIGINDIGIMMNTRRSSAQQQDLMDNIRQPGMNSLPESSPAQAPGNGSSFSWSHLFSHGHAATLPGSPLLSQMSVHIRTDQSKITAPFLSRCKNDLNQEASLSWTCQP